MVYDIGIIGGGVAGAFAALRIAENFNGTKAVLFDLGRPPGKRRRQLEGWLGCFPFGDGKLHTNEIEDIIQVVDGRKARPAEKWVYSILKSAGPTKIIQDKLPNISVQKKAEALRFDVIENPYIQWKPESVHKLSKIISDQLEGNIELQFDNEVLRITKDDCFTITTQTGDFKCNKILIAVGRSGWRWVTDVYKSFGLVQKDDVAKYGIRVEIASQYMKEFNKSHCSFYRDDLEIGPLEWGGTVIPEDHADLVVSAFRANEERWKTDKVSFNIIGLRQVKDGCGIKETDRLAKLAFLLFNDRVGREKIKLLLRKESPLSQLPDYDWLLPVIQELEDVFPAIVARGYYHSPAIDAIAPPVLLGQNLDTDVDGLYVAGESAGFHGIMAAAISGTIAADGAFR
jgi:hypothetical protein